MLPLRRARVSPTLSVSHLRTGTKRSCPSEGEPAKRYKTEPSVHNVEEFDKTDKQNLPVVDLVDQNNVPAVIIEEKEREKNLTCIKNLQCVICMDDCTFLNVTSCGMSLLSPCFGIVFLANCNNRSGHIFCGGCLHESLYVSAAKQICPMCRQNVISRGSKTKGVFNVLLQKRKKQVVGKRPQPRGLTAISRNRR